MTIVPQVPVKTLPDVDVLSSSDKRISLSYYDGLGRPVQEVAHKQSPSQKDLVQIIEYDGFGRVAKQYLPYTSSYGDMTFKVNGATDQASFYQTKARVAHSDYPFSESVFDNSPLNRVVERSAPGVDWKLGSDHTIEFDWNSNAINEVRYWKKDIVTGQITTDGYYAENQLYVQLSKDENGSSVFEYNDKNGNLILKKVQFGQTSSDYALTSYVYDALNRLTAVIPPQVYNDLNGPVGGPNPTELEASVYAPNRIYTYLYDDKGRLIEKKIPHKGVEYIVYNLLDQPVMTQDALQRQSNKWNFTKYDALGRVIANGELTTTGSRASIQALANGNIPQWEERSGNSIYHGYTNVSFPVVGSGDFTVINYYDDYDFNRDLVADHSLQPPTNSSVNYNTQATVRTKGLLTGTKYRILGESTWLISVSFYDEKGRVIQVKSDNYLGGVDLVFSAYNFVGEMTNTLHEHTKDGLGSGYLEIEQRFTYDHAGRPLRTYHRVGQSAEIILVDRKYNELGQLIDKKVHSSNLITPKYLQSIDYAYNIRGWLTHINNDDLDDDEYSNNVIDDGVVVGYQMNYVSYAVEEVTPGDGQPGNSYLALLISDESELIVEGEVNTELYQNGESKLIKLVEAPIEGENLLYTSLYELLDQTFSENFSPPFEINESTTIDDLENWIYPQVESALEGVSYTDPEGVNAIQVAVFNYFAGKAGQIMTPDEAEVFVTSDITIYFEEQNGHNLYMRIDDANSTLSFTPFIMSRTSANQAEYDFLFDLTNPLDDPNDLNSNRSPQPMGISFDSPYLFEGIGTIEAINICKEAAESVLAGINITNTTVITRVNVFARKYALENHGNQFFNDDANDLWGMEIKYNNPTMAAGVSAFGTTALYNGNICETTWKSKGDEVKRGYGYQYDKLNRLLSANYKAYNGTAENWTAEVNRYNVGGISYDLNGNILSLQRYGYSGGTIATPTWGLMDNLAYSYTNGDQLMAVTDNGNVQHINDFNDRNTSGNDYAYDVNGNLIADANKLISNISYNQMNLPTQVSLGVGEDIYYKYDAMGTKVKKHVVDYGVTQTTYYTPIGNYTSSNSGATKNLDFIFTEEGRVVSDNGNWRYEYYYKDQVGNTRLGFTDYNGDQEVNQTEVTQQSNYYPFGLEHKGTDYFPPASAIQTTHKYKFQGQEEQDEFGLGWYSFKWRNAMPELGRFFNTDPLAEDYVHNSVYAFSENRVVDGIELEGLEHLSITRITQTNGQIQTTITPLHQDKLGDQHRSPLTINYTNIDATGNRTTETANDYKYHGERYFATERFQLHPERGAFYDTRDVNGRIGSIRFNTIPAGTSQTTSNSVTGITTPISFMRGDNTGNNNTIDPTSITSCTFSDIAEFASNGSFSYSVPGGTATTTVTSTVGVFLESTRFNGVANREFFNSRLGVITNNLTANGVSRANILTLPTIGNLRAADMGGSANRVNFIINSTYQTTTTITVPQIVPGSVNLVPNSTADTGGMW